MIDILITKIILAITTFVKRHPGVTILIIFLLWIVPPLVAVFIAVANVLSRIKELKFLVNMITKAADWIANNEKLWWWVIYGIAVINPLLGAVLALWTFFSGFKPHPQMTVAPDASSPTPPPVDLPDDSPSARENFSRFKYGY